MDFVVNLLVPYISQFDPQILDQEDACGAASVAMVLNFFGDTIGEPIIFALSGAQAGTPMTASQLITAAQARGFTAEYKSNLTVQDLQNYLGQNLPVITLVHAGDLKSREDQNYTDGHWMVVCGYRNDGYTVNDPDFFGALRDQGDHHFYTKQEFETAWGDCTQDQNPNNSAIIIHPKPQVQPTQPSSPLPANYDAIVHNSTQWDTVCKGLLLGDSTLIDGQVVIDLVEKYKSTIQELQQAQPVITQTQPTIVTPQEVQQPSIPSTVVPPTVPHLAFSSYILQDLMNLIKFLGHNP